jgi:hypothetical protein
MSINIAGVARYEYSARPHHEPCLYVVHRRYAPRKFITNLLHLYFVYVWSLMQHLNIYQTR